MASAVTAPCDEFGEDIFCPKCAYGLHLAPGDKCPECGYPLVHEISRDRSPEELWAVNSSASSPSRNGFVLVRTDTFA